jgi:hypothetical protein
MWQNCQKVFTIGGSWLYLIYIDLEPNCHEKNINVQMQSLMRKRNTPLQIFVVLTLIVSFLLISGSELFATFYDDDCEDHCDEACETCGDCIHCLPTLHMLVGAACEGGFSDQGPSWGLLASSDCFEGDFRDGIDHPPQNCS